MLHAGKDARPQEAAWPRGGEKMSLVRNQEGESEDERENAGHVPPAPAADGASAAARQREQEREGAT